MTVNTVPRDVFGMSNETWERMTWSARRLYLKRLTAVRHDLERQLRPVADTVTQRADVLAEVERARQYLATRPPDPDAGAHLAELLCETTSYRTLRQPTAPPRGPAKLPDDVVAANLDAARRHLQEQEPDREGPNRLARLSMMVANREARP